MNPIDRAVSDAAFEVSMWHGIERSRLNTMRAEVAQGRFNIANAPETVKALADEVLRYTVQVAGVKAPSQWLLSGMLAWTQLPAW